MLFVKASQPVRVSVLEKAVLTARCKGAAKCQVQVRACQGKDRRRLGVGLLFVVRESITASQG